MKRFFGVFFSLIIFLIYFAGATKGAFHTVFTVLFPVFHIILIVSMLIAGNVYVFLWKKKRGFPSLLQKVIFFSLPVAMTLTCVAVNLAFIVAPQPDDGVHYVWLSKLIATGRFYMEIPHFYEHYTGSFIFSHDGRFTSIFLPGFSFFMAPFSKMGIEFLFNPVIAGINTFLIGIHGKALKDRTAGIVAMVLFVFSTTHIMHGALYFPHHFGLMLVLVSTYIVVHKNGREANYIIAGAILSISLFIRTQNAFYTYFATAVFIFISTKKIKPLFFFTFPFFVAGSLLMYYNYYFTKDPFVFLQDVYFNKVNLTDMCHRPGFGKGCREQPGFGDVVPPGGMDLATSLKMSFMRLNNFLFRISIHPLMLLFVFGAVLKRPYKYFLYYFMPICGVVAYFTFFIEGNYWGPRYLLESGALFLILSACGFSEIYQYFKNKGTSLSMFFAGSMTGIVVAVIITFSFVVMPGSIYKYSSPHDLARIKNLIAENGAENSIILVPYAPGFNFGNIMSLHDDPPHDRKGNLIIYSLSVFDENIQKFYKDTKYRAIYRIDKTEKGYQWVPLDFMDDDGVAGLLFPLKSIPVSGAPYFVYPLFEGAEDDRFSFVPSPDVNFHFVVMGVLFNGKGENFYGFEHSMKTEGLYDIYITLIVTDCTVDFHVEVNGEKRGVFLKGENPQKMRKLEFAAPLKAGRNSFKIVPLDDGCLVLDYMFVDKVD
jgi:hypothetical protein